MSQLPKCPLLGPGQANFQVCAHCCEICYFSFPSMGWGQRWVYSPWEKQMLSGVRLWPFNSVKLLWQIRFIIWWDLSFDRRCLASPNLSSDSQQQRQQNHVFSAYCYTWQTLCIMFNSHNSVMYLLIIFELYCAEWWINWGLDSKKFTNAM